MSKKESVLCEEYGLHDFSEFHMYEVVCSRCRICRPYTEEDEANLERKLEENGKGG